MAPSPTEVAAASIVLLATLKKKRRERSRTEWVKKWLLDRRSNFTHADILKELSTYPCDFENYLRMEEGVYLQLLEKVAPMIKKQDTVMRGSISPHHRLMATLRYLATGQTYEEIKFVSRISPQSLGQIIPETCSAIYQSLAQDYLKFPTTVAEWLSIARMFEDTWQFPNCLGAVDGKHVAISPPPDAGSFYYNYKGFHSMVLMAIANANYEFIYVHLGTNGRVSDGGVIRCTDFFNMLVNGTLDLPPSTSNGLPYVFIGDEAFALREDFLKPFNIKALNNQRRIFNYRLSRARRVVENTFGILVARFGVLKSKINLQPNNVEKVVMACCVLHNYLRRTKSKRNTPQDAIDTENSQTDRVQQGLHTGDANIAPLSRNQRGKTPTAAKRTRDLFMDYFNGMGRIPWQDNCLHHQVN